MRKVLVKQSEDGEYYIVPVELLNRFDKLNQSCEYDRLITEFGKYYAGSSVNSIELYANRKVIAVQDDSSHWYIIPQELEIMFDQLLDGDEDAFIDTFDKYRTGGDLNNIQLYADI